MKVCNYLKPFSQEWDSLLNQILDKYTYCSVDRYTIKFKVPKGKFLGIFTTYNTYVVWIANKDCSYGTLHFKNSTKVPRFEEYSPNQKTLDRLYEVEKGQQPSSRFYEPI